MADYPMVENPEFIETMRMIQKSDPVHANIMNALFQQLLNNDRALKGIAENISISVNNRMTDLESEVKTLKDATLNNMTNNVFIETFDSLNSIRLSSGIYDNASKKIYV